MKWLSSGLGVFLLLYVDDMLIASIDHLEVVKLKKLLSTEFEMKDLGKVKRILGMDVVHDEQSEVLNISQKAYLDKVLDRFGMTDAKPVMTPVAQRFKLIVDHCLETDEEVELMSKVPVG